MTTTLRSDRRNRRTATFNLECLDDRIVLSATSAVAAAEAHLALAVSLGHTKAVEKATIILDRDEARLARYDTMASYHDEFRGDQQQRSLFICGFGDRHHDQYEPALPGHSESGRNGIHPGGHDFDNDHDFGSRVLGLLRPAPGNLSSQLQSVFNQFEASGGSSGSANFNPTGLSGLIISGNNVGIHFQTSNSDAFDKDFAQLESDGLQVSSDLPGFGIIEGMLPISCFPSPRRCRHRPA